MKIAVWHNLPSGGGKRALHVQVRGLLSQGHAVEAWCPPTADREFLPLRDLIPEHVVPLKPTRPSRVGPAGFYAETAARLRAMALHTRACADEIRAGGFDLLLAHPCRFFRTAPIGRQHLEIPRVLYLQEPNRWLYEAMPQPVWMAPPPLRNYGRLNYWSYLWLIQDAIETQARRLEVREEVLNAKAFDRILVNSLFSRESLLRAYGVDSKVCYLGVDTDLFVDRHQPREPIVVGIGSIVPEKGVALVIEAVAHVSCAPRLVWIGNHANEDYLKSVHAIAMQKGVSFEAKVRISDLELVDILNRASLMVYAPRLEPFGYAPLEANVCGLPVVAVAEGGLRETIQDGVNGVVVEGDALQIGSAIARLLSDTSLARELGRNGARLVRERWSLAAAAERLEHQLKEAVRARGGQRMGLIS